MFTSANGVRFFLRRLEERGRDLRALGHLKLAAIGPTTAEALAQLSPSRRPRAGHLSLRGARRRSWASAAQGRRILLARADRGRTILKDELEQLADVDQVAVYHNADAESLPESIVERIVDWHGRLDHADQLGHHRAAARLLAGRGPPSDRPRGSPGEPEPGHLGNGRAAGLERRGGSDRIHVGGLVEALVEQIAARTSRSKSTLARLGRRLSVTPASELPGLLQRTAPER